MLLIMQDGAHGEIMKANSNGFIYRPALGMKPSGQWRIAGAREINNFGNTARFYGPDEVLMHPESIPWKWKNGKQRTFLEDFDHGTRRTWGSPGHIVVKDPDAYGDGPNDIGS